MGKLDRFGLGHLLRSGDNSLAQVRISRWQPTLSE